MLLLLALCGCWDLNSHPHPYSVNALPTEPCLQPQATPFEVFTRLRASLLAHEVWVLKAVEVMADHELASHLTCSVLSKWGCQ